MGIAAILAPIMAAIAAIAAAKEQAEADKFIAKTAADASIKQTQIQSETTLSLAADQKAVAEKNLAATEKLAERQEKNSKERLLVQLTAIEKERNAQAAERKEIRDIETKRAQEQIDFARETAKQNLDLAQVALNNQLIQQGLQTTGGSSMNRLSNTASGATAASPLVSSITGSGTLGTGGGGLNTILGSGSSRTAVGRTGTGTGTSVASNGTTITGARTGIAAGATGARAGTGSGLIQAQAASPSRLLASLRQGFVARGMVGGANSGVGGTGSGSSFSRGVTEGFRFVGDDRVLMSQRLSGDLTMAMAENQIINGSTRLNHNRREDFKPSGSDLGAFTDVAIGGLEGTEGNAIPSAGDRNLIWRHDTRNGSGVAGSGHVR